MTRTRLPLPEPVHLSRPAALEAARQLAVRLPVATYALDRERVLDAPEELLIARGRSRAAA